MVKKIDGMLFVKLNPLEKYNETNWSDIGYPW